MHGSNRLGGNSLSDLLVFGRRAGMGASDYASGRAGTPVPDPGEIEHAITEALAPYLDDALDHEAASPYDQ